MEICIFCKIVKGKTDAYKVYEDAEYLAFLDIFPRVPGHLLVIPKQHVKWVYETPDFGQYWEVVLKVTQAVQKSLNPIYVNYFTYGAINHAHIHILPRTSNPLGGENDNIDIVPPVLKPQPTSEELIAVADRIKGGLKK